jgi:microcompartment protein CcmL/EutN
VKGLYVMKKALGVIEVIGFVAAVEAADVCVKASCVQLTGYEPVKGGGRCIIRLEGEIGAVSAAVAAGVASMKRLDKLVGYTIIARPAAGLYQTLLQQTKPVQTAFAPAPAEAIRRIESEEPAAAPVMIAAEVLAPAPDKTTPELEREISAAGASAFAEFVLPVQLETPPAANPATAENRAPAARAGRQSRKKK